MSDPILTLEAAKTWLDHRGWDLQIIANDRRSPAPQMDVLIAAVEAVRCVVEAPELERVTPCPESELETTCRALASGMRVVAEEINTLRRGANEAQRYEIARKLFNMRQDLSALAGMVQP